MAHQEQTEKDFLSCSICLEILKEPKTLSCMHRFCESCLTTHIISSVKIDTFGTRGFSCPLCRIFISVPNYLSPPSAWASHFKTDFDVKGLIELVQSRKEYSQCKLPTIKHPCPKHTDKDCQFYCVDCCETACDTCAIISHRACNQMLTLEDAAKDRRTALRSQIHQISAQIGEAVEQENLCESYMRDVDDKKASIEQEIRDFAQKLRQLVTSQEEKLLNHIEKNYLGFQEQVSLKVSKFEDTVNKARHTIRSASSKTMCLSDFDLMSDRSCCDVLTECDIADVASEYTRFSKKLSEVKCLFKKSSVPDITLGKSAFYYNLNDEDISNNSSSACDKGNVARNLEVQPLSPKTSQVFSYAAACTSNKPKETLPVVITPDEPLAPANKLIQRSIKTRLRQDIQKPCINSLIVVAPSDTVLVTDWANKNLKAFPNKRGRSTSLTLDYHPWGITQVTDVSAAVSLPSSQQICLIMISRVLDVDRYIQVSKPYQGLAAFMSFGSAIIVASSCQSPSGKLACVDFLTTSGQVLKSFTNDNSGLPLFNDPAYLCVTPDKIIVVSDVGHKTVKYVAQDGQFKFTYPPEGAPSMQNPKGVTCAPSGHILVVDDGNLLSLTTDGQLERALTSAKDNLCISGAVAVDSTGLVYVVDNDDDIKVLKIRRL